MGYCWSWCCSCVYGRALLADGGFSESGWRTGQWSATARWCKFFMRSCGEAGLVHLWAMQIPLRASPIQIQVLNYIIQDLKYINTVLKYINQVCILSLRRVWKNCRCRSGSSACSSLYPAGRSCDGGGLWEEGRRWPAGIAVSQWRQGGGTWGDGSSVYKPTA